MKWVKSLIITEQQSPERRIATIVEYIYTVYNSLESLVSDIEATGEFGMQLTKKTNNNEIIRLSNSEILALLNEDGQIIELDLHIYSIHNFRIIVRDGYIVDLLGDAEFPDAIIGEHTDLDLAHY